MKELKLEDEKQNTKNTENKKKRIGNKEDDLFRVVISKESNEILEDLVQRTNDGFDGGEVTKSDVVNQLILNHGRTFSELDIKALRNLHFDERKVLRSLLKKAGNDGDLPSEIKRVLREHLGLSEASKKRSQKVQTDLSTEKAVDN